MQCYNYNHRGELKKEDCKTEIVVLDSNHNLIKLSQSEAGAQFIEQSCRNLGKEDALKQIVKQKKSNQSMIISERSVICRDQVLNIESGRTYEALKNCLSPDYKVTSSELVHGSDQIMYTAMGKSNELQLFFKRDAGRRNCNPVGTKGLRDCLSFN